MASKYQGRPSENMSRSGQVRQGHETSSCENGAIAKIGAGKRLRRNSRPMTSLYGNDKD
jgi:hypothetical protein